MIASLARSRAALLDEIGAPADLALVHCAGAMRGRLAAAGARALLGDLRHRNVSLQELAAVRGDVALLTGCDLTRRHHLVACRALAIAEMRFDRVIVLPCSAGADNSLVARTLSRTGATVFASDPESRRRLAGLCAAPLAHDCSFFYDYAAVTPNEGVSAGILNAFAADLGQDRVEPLPQDNVDISLTERSLTAWLARVASSDVVRTDRIELVIAAGMIGKRVEYSCAMNERLGDLARHVFPGAQVSQIPTSEAPVVAPIKLGRRAAATVSRVRRIATATPLPSVNAGAESKPRVTAVVLTQGRPGYLRRALDSLDGAGVPLRTIVIDNDAPAIIRPSIEAICRERSNAVLHHSESNLGCAGGRNLGVQLADTELVMFLDDDAELMPNALRHLVHELDSHPDALAVTATVIRGDGTIVHSGGSMVETDDVVCFELLGDGQPFSPGALPVSGPSGWMPATACLNHRSILLEFPFDPGMQTYFEDNHWSRCVRSHYPDPFRRSREAIAVHHIMPKHSTAPDFAARCQIASLLESYSCFYRYHGRLIAPWIFDHVVPLRASDGSEDAASARLLMELVDARGIDWVLMEWMNGGLDGLINAGDRLARLRSTRSSLEAATDELKRLRREEKRLNAAVAEALVQLEKADQRFLAASARYDEEIEHREREISALRAKASSDADTIASLDASLNESNRRLRRIEESVTWQLFQRTRARLFGMVGGEDSAAVHMLQGTLRFVGQRTSVNRSGPPHRQPSPSVAAALPTASGADRPDRTGELELKTSPEPVASIVVPLYSGAALTRAALKSIGENTYEVPYEVILVDDTADPETKRLLSDVNGASVISNEANLGYLRSVHRGVAAARGKWLVLCNNDIEVQPGWLSALVECGESNLDVAIVAPKYLYPDGRLSEAGGIVWRDGTGANYGRGDAPDCCHYEYRRDIDYGSAAALLVSAEFWREVGGFDELFLPMYYEDTDLCFQARARGLRVIYEPRAHVVHVEGGTAGSDENSGHKRHQAANRPRFVSKWRERLEAEHLPSGQPDQWLGANLRRRHRVLVVDHRLPMWDRESGALRMRGILEALLDLNSHVTFLPDNHFAMQPYTRELQRMGVEVLYGVDQPTDLIRILPSVSLTVLSRPHVAARWLDTVRAHGKHGFVLYDTVDLHWLREARRAAVEADLGVGELLITPRASALREIELGLIRACDATAVVTSAERDLVKADVPHALVHVLPNVNPVKATVPGYANRSGVLFVGGFEHPPNTDAALRLVRDVMPLIWDQHPEATVTIVGADPPAELRAMDGERVHVVGWVPEIDPVLDGAAALVAPISYGAGLKGKVTQALAAGLPVVTTPVGAEGLGAVDGDQLLIATDAQGLAARVLRLLDEPELWARLSSRGQELVAALCSPQVIRERLSDLLAEATAERFAATAVNVGGDR